MQIRKFTRCHKEKGKKGNPNIRISEDYTKIYVNDPRGRGLWIEGKIFVPKKFRDVDFSKYGVKLLYRQENDTFEVRIDYDVEVSKEITQSKSKGVIGIDLNPNLIALVETNSDGNLIKLKQFSGQRIPYARADKRDIDIRLIAKEVVEYALGVGKPIVVEELKFNQKKKSEGSKRWKRTKSNFAHDKMIETIIARAQKLGVEVLFVNPAFTSELGMLKYASMYNLSRHGAAALVIARRGQFSTKSSLYRERVNFKENFIHGKSKGQDGRWNLEGRSYAKLCTPKAYKWLKDKFVVNSHKGPAAHGCSLQQLL